MHPLITSATSRSILRTSLTIFNNTNKLVWGYNSRRSSSSSSPTCSPSPWLMLPPSAAEEYGRTYNFYSLAKEKVVSFNCNNRTTKMRSSYPDMDESEFVGSSHGWIALFNPRNTDMFLLNPLTGRHIKLPPMDTIYTPPNEYTRPWVNKLIITCPPDSLQGTCRAVMLYDTSRLAYCTPGSSTRWTGPIDPHYTRRVGDCGAFGTYDDFVYDTKYDLLICIGYGYEAWDITSSTVDQFNPKSLVFENRHLLHEYYRLQSPHFIKDGHGVSNFKHLVEYDGQIFLLIREVMSMEPCDRVSTFDDDFPYKTVAFHVHKVEHDQGLLLGESEADSLGGLAMFVGINHAFALPAASYPGIVPNSVYFTEHWSSIPPRIPVDGAYGGHDIGVFDYESKTISPCFYPCDEHSFKRIMPAPMWFTPTPNPTEI